MDARLREHGVLLCACDADGEAAATAAVAARRAGYEVRRENLAPASNQPCDTPCDITLCVVLLSEEAAAAPGFLERANALAEHMPATIPVRLDGLTPERCGAPGSPIRERHWADARNHPSIWQEIFHSHVWLYPAYDDLAARTARWETCGRDDSFLMQSVNQAKQACALIDEMRDDSFQRPSDAMVQYAHASHTFAQRQRRRTRRHSLVLVAAIAAAVATVVIVRGVVAAHVEHAVQSAQSVYSMRLETDPAFFSFQTYCAMRDAGGVEPEQVHALTAGLERPWAMGILGTENFNAGGWQGEGVFAQTGAQYWVRADGGALQQWNILAFEPVSAIRVSSSDTFVFDVTADGAGAVVADADGVAMIDLETGERTALDTACTDGVAIACSEDGSQIAVQTASAIAVYENGARAREVDLAGTDVLALTRTAAGLRALCATSAEAAGTAATAEEAAVGETVRLIDLTTGEVVAQAPLPAAEMLTGTILPAGEALVCSNGTVSRLSAASALEPVGFTTRDAPSALASDGNVLVVATEQDGVQVVDLATGTVLETIARDLAGVCYLSISDTGVVACGNGFVTSIWSLLPIAPDIATVSGVVSAKTTYAAESATAELADAETLRITHPECALGASGSASDAAPEAVEGDAPVPATQPATLDIPLAPYGDLGTATSVCIAPYGGAVALGFDTGHVLVFDLASNGQAYLCRAWQVPTADGVEQVGFSSDGARLMVEAAGRWWHPWSNSGCTSMEGLVPLLRARQPKRWPLAQWQTFPEDIRQQLGMACATAAPAAR